MMHMDDLTERTVSREDLFTGKVVSLHVDKVELPNGDIATREVVEHVDGVAVLPLDENGCVYTVTQYRYVFRTPLLEIPAGKLDSKQEDPLAAARRELQEETGMTADTWINLGIFYPAPAYSDETIHMFLARDLHPGDQHLDADEFLEVTQVPIEELVDTLAKYLDI